MADDKRERGARNMEDVCGMPAPPAGFGRFVDLTVEHLFGEVRGNDALSVRDRRLTLGQTRRASEARLAEKAC